MNIATTLKMCLSSVLLLSHNFYYYYYYYDDECYCYFVGLQLVFAIVDLVWTISLSQYNCDLKSWSNAAISASVWRFYPTLSFSSFFLCTNEQILLNIVVWHCVTLWSLTLHPPPAHSVPLKAVPNLRCSHRHVSAFTLQKSAIYLTPPSTGSHEDGRVN